MNKFDEAQPKKTEAACCGGNKLLFLRVNKPKQALSYLLYFLSMGIFYLLNHWFISLQMLQYNAIEAENATHVLVCTKDGIKEIIQIRSIAIPLSSLGISSSEHIVNLEVKYK
ncbi:unnamed protein product [Blepharisma stoltei]|uniref:Cation-transporting ATPase n=1 Tax=Blepharisma stoltei TaxID=1481888 RepID=A0AAU9IY78_9CILI|nr:unnamed protein product [Blepharisma stoltei]